nr:hypothetical protein [Spiroplasma tabanidicola]
MKYFKQKCIGTFFTKSGVEKSNFFVLIYLSSTFEKYSFKKTLSITFDCSVAPHGESSIWINLTNLQVEILNKISNRFFINWTSMWFSRFKVFWNKSFGKFSFLFKLYFLISLYKISMTGPNL